MDMKQDKKYLLQMEMDYLPKDDHRLAKFVQLQTNILILKQKTKMLLLGNVFVCIILQQELKNMLS